MEPHVPSANSDKPALRPVMDVVPPPKPAEDAEASPTPAVSLPVEPSKDQANAKKLAMPKPPHAPHNGVGLAIAATVIIVLGLAALMAYAYLRTQGVSIF